MSSDYKKLSVKKYPRLHVQKDTDTKFWKSFKRVTHVKELSPSLSVEFSPVSPFDFAVTNSSRVQIYSSRTHTIKKNISRFKENAYCASFRKDGKLLVSGDESGFVQIFDLNSRAILRTFDEHRAAVHSTRFLCSNTQIVSASDDKSIKIWDITLGSVVTTFEGHNGHDDYVRSTAVSHRNPNFVVSGSYDHTVKLWDLRMNKAALKFKHGSASHPVEAVLMFPGDNVIFSAGGTSMMVWDVLSGGKLLSCTNNHQKTITSMCFDSTFSRVATGSLDHHVKIYDVRDYTVSYSLKYSAPVLAVAISPKDSHIVATMSSGLMSIRERAGKKSDEEGDPFALTGNALNVIQARHQKDMMAMGGSFKYFIRGQHKQPSEMDLVVSSKRKPKLLEFEKQLKMFKYGAALDSALSSNLPPTTIVTLIEELTFRDGLLIALSGRDEVSLEAILNFIHRYISNPRYTCLLSKVLDLIMDSYTPLILKCPVLYEIFRKIRRKTRTELELQKEMHNLMGLMDMILGFSETNRIIVN
jgi:U3 small nucleolar RNA-associated protein 15